MFSRKGLFATVLAALLLATGFSDGGDVDPSTVTYEGAGSLGRDSHIELFLSGGIYSHELTTRHGCPATAGLFPAQREPAAALGEVLDPTDLAAYVPRLAAAPAGTFRITTPGWVTLQLGTGPDCAWTYVATGRFLTQEDATPLGNLGESWLIWVTLAAIATAVVFRLGRRPPGGGARTERLVRVIEPHSDRPA